MYRLPAMDETRINAAPTPAHVFAYRAFRSVFVASPESSPLRPQIAPYDNKENTQIVDARYLKASISPSSTKRKSGGGDLLSLTPKRQKTVAISPTKSILKNPNAPTPRRPGLRDINVSFKDVRKSASPDLAQRLTVMSINSQSGSRVTSEPLFKAATAEEAPKAQRSVTVSAKTPTPQSIEQEHADMVADIVRDPAFDVNDYVVKTEKELRRFAAYGKKWKKYAQKQDEEVKRLKAMLEEAQEENRRLQRRVGCGDEEKRTGDSQTVDEKDVDKPSKKKSFLVSMDSQDLKLLQKDKDRRGSTVAERTDTNATSDTAAPLPKHERSISTDTKRSQKSNKLDARPTHSKAEPSASSSGRHTSFIAQDIKSPAQQPKKKDASKQTIMPAEIPQRSISTVPSLTGAAAARTSMTLDRQAAARERIRQRNEERMASLRLNSLAPPTDHAPEKPAVRQPSSGLSIDESELDWADLGH